MHLLSQTRTVLSHFVNWPMWPWVSLALLLAALCCFICVVGAIGMMMWRDGSTRRKRTMQYYSPIYGQLGGLTVPAPRGSLPQGMREVPGSGVRASVGKIIGIAVIVGACWSCWQGGYSQRDSQLTSNTHLFRDVEVVRVLGGNWYHVHPARMDPENWKFCTYPALNPGDMIDIKYEQTGDCKNVSGENWFIITNFKGGQLAQSQYR